MSESDLLFYFLALFVLCSSLLVVSMKNPIYSALSMAGTMIGLAFLFFSLEAYFIAGVQLAVYAGAVMVLFVMVLMIFNLREEKNTFSKGFYSNLTKLIGVGFFFGFLSMIMYMSSDIFITSPSARKAKKERSLQFKSESKSMNLKDLEQFKDVTSSQKILENIKESKEGIDKQPLKTLGGSSALETKKLAKKLFKVYFFAFELLGILLLVIAVGAVVVSSKMKEKIKKGAST